MTKEDREILAEMEEREKNESIHDVADACRLEAKLLMAQTGSDEGYFHLAERIENAFQRDHDKLLKASACMAEEIRDLSCRVIVREIQERGDGKSACNARVMRNALEKVKHLFDGRLMFQPAIRACHEAVNAALAAPPRNCDLYANAEEAEKVFRRWCMNWNNYHGCMTCRIFDVGRKLSCFQSWLFAPAEPEK